MQKTKAALAASIAIVMALWAVPVVADDQEEETGPPPSPSWGVTIWNPASAYVPNYLELTYGTEDDGTEDSATRVGVVCFDDTNEFCEAPDTENWDFINYSGRVYLDPCTEATPENTPCIEALLVGTAADEELPAAILAEDRPEGGFTWRTADVAGTPIPVTGQPSLWDAEVEHAGEATTYTAMVSVEFNWSPGQTTVSYTDYAASVTPVVVTRGTDAIIDDEGEEPVIVVPANHFSRVTASMGEEGGFSWSGGSSACLWNDRVSTFDVDEEIIESSICAERAEFSPGTVVELSVRLPKTISGWYKGRVTSPVLTVTSSVDDASMNIITVRGEPSYRVPQLDVEQPLDETPETYVELAERIISDGGGGILLADDNAETVTYIESLKALNEDKANSEISVWQFATLSPAVDDEGRCQPSSGIAGMVSTDAMAYSGEPPVYEGGELKYRVAGMHWYSTLPEDPETEDLLEHKVLGSYDLLIEAEYARCLYRLADADIAPTVSVFETSTDAPKVGASLAGFSETGGWMNFNVRGITFSNPTIAINFNAEQSNDGQQGGGNTAGPVATPVVAPTSPVNLANPIPAGKTNVVLVGGVAVDVAVKPDPSSQSLEFVAADWSLKVAPGGTGTALTAKGELIVPASGSTQLSGSGFKPGTKVAALLIPINSATIASAGGPGNFATLATPTVVGELTVGSAGGFNGIVNTQGMAPGNYALQINGLAPDDKLRSLSIATVVPQPEFKAWAKRTSETEAKVYARNPIGAGKVQFLVNGRELAWVRAENSSDRKLRRAANGVDYLVRTITLEPGKNRIEIKVDGVRVKLVTYTG